jgi:hypothetical protein
VSPDTMKIVLVVLTVITIIAVVVAVVRGAREGDAWYVKYHGGLTSARRDAIIEHGARMPAVVLAVDRVTDTDESKNDLQLTNYVEGPSVDQHCLVMIVEIRPPEKPAYRVEVHDVFDRDLEPYSSVGTDLFVFVDPRDPKVVVVDHAELWARQKVGVEQQRVANADAEAAQERDAAKKRERLLGGG